MTHDQAEDLLQDAACKVVAKRVPFVDADDLTRFVQHATRHLWIDRLRSAARRRTETASEVDLECRDDADVAIAALTAQAAWSRLRRSDQLTLLAADEPGGSAEYVRRSRARKRLAAILLTLEGWLIWSGRQLRAVRPRRREVATVLAVFFVSVIAIDASRPHSRDAGVPQNRQLRTTPSPVVTAATTNQGPTTLPTARLVPASDRRPPYKAYVATGPPMTIVLGPAKIERRPTESGDPILCLLDPPVIGPVCVGDATKLLPPRR